MNKIDNINDVLNTLKGGKLKLEGQFIYGSNNTYLAHIQDVAKPIKVIYKPVIGERPLYDFPIGTLGKREVAAFQVSQQTGWDLVPPTIFRTDNLPMGPGSLQLYIEHDPELHYFTFEDHIIQRMRPIVLFDILINNADRKGGHILLDKEQKLWLIDHGICFHKDYKLRTVIWDFIGETISEELILDLQKYNTKLKNDSTIKSELLSFLNEEEFQSLQIRAENIITNMVFPMPDQNNRPYPWPPI